MILFQPALTIALLGCSQLGTLSLECRLSASLGFSLAPQYPIWYPNLNLAGVSILF